MTVNLAQRIETIETSELFSRYDAPGWDTDKQWEGCELNSLTKSSSVSPSVSRARVLMLLSNCFNPDPRVHSEARSLVQNRYEVLVLAWDRERQRPMQEVVDGILIKRIRLRSVHNRGTTQAFYIAA